MEPSGLDTETVDTEREDDEDVDRDLYQKQDRAGEGLGQR
jgi:hypothetical protein